MRDEMDAIVIKLSAVRRTTDKRLHGIHADAVALQNHMHQRRGQKYHYSNIDNIRQMIIGFVAQLAPLAGTGRVAIDASGNGVNGVDLIHRSHRNYTSDSCPCSLGECQSIWPCTPSTFCWERGLPMTNDLAPPRPQQKVLPIVDDGVTFLLFLAFNASFTRGFFTSRPWRARDREVNRALWFVHTAHAVGTRLPIHAVVAGERHAASEARLIQAGVKLLHGTLVPPPPWASSFHRLSFNKILALSFTQFRKVIVVDNDVGLVQNMDDLRHAPTPSAVFHTTLGKLSARTQCAVTTGLLVLRPSAVDYGRALALLARMNYSRAVYDGGDEELWLDYFSEVETSLYELPWRYHAHKMLPLPPADWVRVRMMHLIPNLASRGQHIPKTVMQRVEHYVNWHLPNVSKAGSRSKWKLLQTSVK